MPPNSSDRSHCVACSATSELDTSCCFYCRYSERPSSGRGAPAVSMATMGLLPWVGQTVTAGPTLKRCARRAQHKWSR